MTRIAVLGSSGASSYLATILAEDPRVTEIVRGESSDPAPAVFNSDLVVGPRSPDPEAERAAASAAIAARVPYLSIAASPDVAQALIGLHGRAVDAGSLVVTGMSWSPGLSNLMAVMASSQLDPPLGVRVSWAISSAGQTAETALARGAGALQGPAHILKDGMLLPEPAGTGREMVFMPEPVGWVPLRVARASEMFTLPRSIPGLEELVVMGGLVEALPNRLASTPAASALTATLGKKVMAFAGKLKPPQPWSALRVDAIGGRDGITTTISYGIVDHLANLLTAPVVVGALMLAELGVKKSGVLSPEDLFDPANFFARLAYQGVRLAKLERTRL